MNKISETLNDKSLCFLRLKTSGDIEILSKNDFFIEYSVYTVYKKINKIVVIRGSTGIPPTATFDFCTFDTELQCNSILARGFCILGYGKISSVRKNKLIIG